MDLFVDGQDVDFVGFGLPDLDGVSGFEVFYVRDFEFEEIAGSDSVVDAEGEEKEITGFVRQEGFDGVDVLGVLDGVDEYFGPWFRMIGIFHVRLHES